MIALIILGVILILWVFLIFLPSLAMFTVRCSADPKQLQGFKLWNWRMYVWPHAYGKWLGNQARASLQPRNRSGRRDAAQGPSEDPTATQPVSFGGNRIGPKQRECVFCAHVWTPPPGHDFQPCPVCNDSSKVEFK